MTPQEFKQLADAIIQGVAWPWWAYTLPALLVFAAAYLGAYAKTKGQNFATKEDFKQLLGQVAQQTSVTKGIESHISHGFWREQQWTTLRQIKLEELVAAAIELRKLARDSAHQLFKFETVYFPATDPFPLSIQKLEVLQQLYFPELVEQALKIRVSFEKYRQKVEACNQESRKLAAMEAQGQQCALDESLLRLINEELPQLHEEFAQGVTELCGAAAQLLQEIMSGVIPITAK